MARKFSVALVLAWALVLAACGDGGGGSDQDDGRLSVVASFYPLAEAAGKIGGDRVDVENLTPAGTEPHDLELTPPQVDDLEGADVALVMGRGFQPAVEEVAERGDGMTVELLKGLPIPREGEVAEEGDEGEAGALDPHVWLDPDLMGAVVGEVTDALAQADPAGADAYRRGAEAFGAELTDLDGRYRQVLGSCQRDVMVVAHEAFGWMARRYGLEQRAITGLEPDQEPDPDRLAELSDLVEAEGITTVFTETLVSPEVAEALARETGTETAVLDPLEGLSEEDLAEGKDYLSVMEDNLAALGAALGCA